MSDLPRAVPLDGVSNFRDLGGWRATGSRVRFGRVFRSASLADMTAADAGRIAALGIRAVCDLRGRREAAAAPFPAALLPGIALHALPIEPTVGASLRDILATRAATGRDATELMIAAYEAYAEEWSHRYRAIFDLLADPVGGAVLFHCSAGKDRTGFGAALILTALGVSEADVMEDYLATNRLWRGDAEMGSGLPREAAAVLLTVQPLLLRAAFDAIGRLGGFARYAASRLGLDPAGLAVLHATLLEPAVR
ncbi:MAG: tyrosine-protein phosphatase [Rhodospirillales bacterium]|nr:tyrosine-protein phosphatase [Rhodospirillales bacterium]